MVCHCTLAGTRACWNCPNNTSFVLGPGNPPTRKITEEYDGDGRLIKRIIEEHKIINEPYVVDTTTGLIMKDKK